MWRRRRTPAATGLRADPDPEVAVWVPTSNVPPVLPTPSEVGVRLAGGLDDTMAARIAADTLWDGSVPGYTAAQAVQTLATLRERAAVLDFLDPGSVPPAAQAADLAAGALRAVLVLSGHTTYDSMRGDATYVAYDMTRRLLLLAEAVAEPRTWAGAASRAQWAGLVGEWAGLEVADDRPAGLVALAPLVKDLRRLRPLPGADPAPAGLRLVEPVLVAAVQRALRWAPVAAVRLLPSPIDPRTLDAALPAPARDGLPTAERARARLGDLDPAVGEHYALLHQAESDLWEEVAPSKRAGGHMDVRPDEEVVARLLWQAESASAAVAVLCRRLLSDSDARLCPSARDAADLLVAVGARAGSFPDEATSALRSATDLALVLTACCLRT